MPEKVVIKAYSKLGKILYEQAFSISAYYDESHSLIDSDEARRFYKVARIEVRFVSQTETFTDWDMFYDELGTLVETWSITNGKREKFVTPSIL